MATKTVFITTGTTFTIPSDFKYLSSVEIIGGGGTGYSHGLGYGSGGGGGAYANSTSITGLTAGGTAYVSFGVAGGTTYFNTTNAAPTVSSTGVLAQNGVTATTTTGALGGSSTSLKVKLTKKRKQ